jgi:outer membrane protein
MVEYKRFTGLVFRAQVCLVLVGSLLLLSLSEAHCNPSRSSRQKLGIHQAIAIALRRNLSLTTARMEVRKKEHNRRAAYSDFFPKLSLKYDATADRYWNLDNIEDFYEAQDARWQWRLDQNGKGFYPSYPYRIDPYRTFELSGTLTQPIFSGGKLLANYELARLGVNAAQIQEGITRQDLILQVIQAYYQLMLAEKLLHVSDDSIEQLKALMLQSRALFEAHVVLKVDVLAVGNSLADERLRRSSALGNIDRTRAMLNYLLRFPQGTPVRTTGDLTFEPSPYRIPQIFAIAAANRLEIRKANITVKEALAAIKVARAGLLPEISMAIEGTRTNDDWNPFDPEAFNDWTVEGVLTWTFDMFRSRETVKRERVAYAQEFVKKEHLIERIMREVQQAYADVKRYERDISTTRQAVEFSRENFQANRELYQGQLATYLEILTAQTQLSNAQREYYRTLMQHRISRAVLERQMGILQ